MKTDEQALKQANRSPFHRALTNLWRVAYPVLIAAIIFCLAQTVYMRGIVIKAQRAEIKRVWDSHQLQLLLRDERMDKLIKDLRVLEWVDGNETPPNINTTIIEDGAK